jgi:hypothetical protein
MQGMNRGDGIRLENWDGGNRSCLKIDLFGTRG